MKSNKLKILVIDDDSIDREQYHRLLKKSSLDDFTYFEKENGIDGLHAIEQINPDIILLDQNLPDITGINILEEISIKQIPVLPVIILLTGEDDRETDLNAMALGAFDYILKSNITKDSLDRCLRYGLKQKHRETLVLEAKAEADRANKMKSHFLANMSHEFRTPLNGIIGFMDLISETTINSEQTEIVDSVRYCSENLLHLVNDILDISKIEANEVHLEHLSYDLNNVIVDTIKLVQNKSTNSNLILEVDMPYLEYEVMGDSLRMNQVLINLLSNAVKFTEKGFVRLQLKVNAESSRFIDFTITVEDSGIGMTKDQSLIIFDSFKQADGSTLRKFGGTGLGLAICKSLVEMMGGNITVESIPGKGSSFQFTIEMEKSSQLKAPLHIPKDKKCLVDSRLLTKYKYLSKILTSANISPIPFNSCAHLLEIFSEHKSAKVIFDFDHLENSWKIANNDGILIKHHFDNHAMDLCVAITQLNSSTLKRLNAYRLKSYLQSPLTIKSLSDLMASGELEMETINNEEDDDEIYEALDILIVEDNKMNQKLITKMLDRLGHKTAIASNGLEAVKKNEENTYDLIFMDMQMPVMDGITATLEIRKKDTITPIVAMTANAFQSDRENCFKAGMVDFCAKPIKKIDVEQAIKKNVLKHFVTIKKSNSPLQKILICIEDEEKRQILKHGLKQKFVNVLIEEAIDGISACIKLGSYLPDLIIIDLNLTKINTTDFITYINSMKELNEIQFIILGPKIIDDSLKKQLSLLTVGQVFQKPHSINKIVDYSFNLLINEKVIM
ncbi:MAG: hypothetical protein COA79_03580 [Planctomycetota bacterium]|nr:MAG: hypothetical protein COA79_03580 [Planctomycetota bacterium]